jgi:hypothetical protein
MPEHKFKIGERLFLVRSIATNMPGEAYVVMKDCQSMTVNLNIR